MTRLRKRRIGTANFLGDQAIVRFKDEIQLNQKQLAAAFGTSYLVPGNFLPSLTLPTLSSYIAMYEKATIVRTTVKADFTNIEATYSKSVGVTQLPIEETNVTPSATVYLSEQPRTKSAYLTPLSGSKSKAVIMNSGTSQSAWGTRTDRDDTVLLTATMTTPPTNQADVQQPWWFDVWTQNVSGAGTLEAAGTNIRIQTWYTIRFYDRKQPTS